MDRGGEACAFFRQATTQFFLTSLTEACASNPHGIIIPVTTPFPTIEQPIHFRKFHPEHCMAALADRIP